MECQPTYGILEGKTEEEPALRRSLYVPGGVGRTRGEEYGKRITQAGKKKLQTINPS